MKLKHFLLTALLLFSGVSGVYAGRHYVGFSSVPSGTNYTNKQLKNALEAAAGKPDTVFVAVGLYLADTTTAEGEWIVPQGVTLIGGYDKGDATTLTRRYPGQFVPFDSSNLSNTTKFTVLDGNAYQRSLASKKHRVITVQNGGVVDGCLIRNGHVRNGNGGGVLLDGGKLYNSIVRGNVAMSKPDTIESLGGGVFIQNGGELINCLVAYNMANDGYGVAAGTGGGKMINNTITANTYAPVFAKIPGGTFRMYRYNNTLSYRPGGEIPKYDTLISLRDFYISRILTTEGQFAVFCAAVDIAPITGSPIIGRLSAGVLANLKEPIFNSGNLNNRYNFNSVTSMQEILRTNTNEYQSGLNYAGGVWYPHLDTASVEYPMANVSWLGCLAYSVWLGGGLPTAAQWEYAARSEPNGSVNDNLYSGAYGTTSSYAIDTWRILDTIAWVDSSVSIDTTAANFGNLGAKWRNRPHEVARKRPNAVGIYDMTGNVGEFTADWRKEAYATFLYSSPYIDPINKAPYLESHVIYASTTTANPAGFPLVYRSSSSSASSANGFRPIVAF